ncbi:MAG: MarR family transcriptional regulator [Nitrospinae bacterium]|nr:MarR family transcriptional regulator [Nitrospinota bacterium]
MKTKKIEIDATKYELFFRAFTDKRLEVLRVIKKEHSSSVYELANFLNRNLKNVSDDVHYLAGLGLIEFEKAKSNGREKTIPTVDYEKILLEIPV